MAARILVVDDQRANVEMMAEVLRARGYEVLTAPSGEAALAQVRAERPDILVSDILMPGVDGYELWDPWILLSIVIWAISGYAGGQAGKAFAGGAVGGREAGIRYQAINSVGLFVILILMIWKPGS